MFFSYVISSVDTTVAIAPLLRDKCSVDLITAQLLLLLLLLLLVFYANYTTVHVEMADCD